jgi:glutaredoxin
MLADAGGCWPAVYCSAMTFAESMQRRAAASLAFVVMLLGLACGPERPPQPDSDSSQRSGQAGQPGMGPAVLDASNDQFVLTYAGERGVFADCTTIAEVPEPARSRVGVNLLNNQAPPGKIWVANLGEPLPDGRYALDAIPRDEFEETVLGSGRSSAFELPDGLDSLEGIGAPEAPVIVYKTSWCGVCKQLESYLTRKGIAYVSKDIEQDRTAAAELAAKAKAAGVSTGSVPMIDVGGKLLRGFDRNALEQLL